MNRFVKVIGWLLFQLVLEVSHLLEHLLIIVVMDIDFFTLHHVLILILKA